jgi:hypothetical protein
MTIASFFRQRRRVLILCAATLALHYLAIDWAGSRLGPQNRSAPPPSLVTAQLKLALPEPAASHEPEPELQPLAQAAPRKQASKPAPPPPAPEPEPAADSAPDAAMAASDASAGAAADGTAPDATSANASANASASSAATAPGAAAQNGADAQSQAAAQAAAQNAAPAQAAPAEPAPVSTRRYKVNLPPPADFELELARVDADGTKWAGVGSMSWHTDGSKYQVGVEVGISMLITRINLLVLNSEGTIDDYGIAPDTFTEKRKGRSLTATHFNRNEGNISFSASEQHYPLLAGAQDKATVPFQLGGIGRANVSQLGGDIDILVGEDKEANIFRFQLVGEEELETKLGKLQTVHLLRPPKPGTYSSKLEIWLAPGLNWYPVQIRNTEASGALTTQTVSRITRQ